jgi:signal transduction histidine kinase
MIAFSNIDLFSVGIAMAAGLILGIVVFISDRKNATTKLFFSFVIISVIWSIMNYLSYQTNDSSFKLWTIRLVLFFASFHAFIFFMLMRTFPNASVNMGSRLKWGLVTVTCIVALLVLSPLVFPRVVIVPGSQIAQPVPAFGIGIFALFVLTMIISGVVSLIRKIRKAATDIERIQFKYLLSGVVLMFGLIVIFNFLMPAFFNDSRFVPFAAAFTLPFIVCAAYAIFKHHLLSVKVVSTEILAFLLTAVTFSEIIFSQSLVEILFRIGEFILVLVFGILLIQSVLREVEQREELQRLNDKLDAANKQLEELSHFKSELLSLASHQIRSPLAAIKGFGTLITTGAYGPVPDVIKAKVEQMSKSADSLISLINTLLDMRKVDEGKMDYQMARADLNKIVNDVVDLMKPLAETKKLEFKFDSPGHEIPVNADAEKLKQVIQNLTDNAIKYTPAGFVHLELKEEPSTTPGQAPVAIVTVSDSGVGFAPDLAPHLFEEFIRDARVKKQILGTGLGLYIARKIAEAHGGTVWAESAGEGKGSAFHVKVPEVK